MKNKKTKSLAITMDFRESNSGIGEILKQSYGVEVKKTKLNTGDYVINEEIVVERKTTLDFIQSIVDGRLFRQAIRMKRRLDFSVLIVEGNNLYDTSVDIHPHSIKGALVSLILMWRIPVLFTMDVRDTALLLWLIGNQRREFYSELSHRPGRRPKQFYKKQLYILQGLPQVGPKLALRLLNHFDSLEKALTASDKELRLVPGVGKVKAEKIRGIVTKNINKTLSLA